MNSFKLKTPGTVRFGFGSKEKLFKEIRKYGNEVLILTDGCMGAFREIFEGIFSLMQEYKINYTVENLTECSSIETVDELCRKYSGKQLNSIVAIGGEDVINSAKILKLVLSSKKESFEQMLSNIDHEFMDFNLPLVIMPTVACVDRAVSAEAWFEINSPEHDYGSIKFLSLMPDIVIVDPELCFSMPYEKIETSCMYTLANLTEIYTSLQSTVFSDLLALEGIEKLSPCLEYMENNDDMPDSLKENICYASLLAGIASQNVEQGIIKGLSVAVRKYYNLPLADISSALLYKCTLKNMQRIQFYDKHADSIEKYAKIGSVFSGIDYSYEKKDVLMRGVSEYLEELSEKLHAPTLSSFGVKQDYFYKISVEAEQFANPVELADTEILDMLEACL